MIPLRFKNYTTVNALGRGVGETFHALLQSRTGLRPCDFENRHIETYIGKVEGIDNPGIGNGLDRFDCRNNRLALLGVQQDGFQQSVAETCRKYGAHRLAVIMGTSTSGILEVEHAYQNRDGHTQALPASFYVQAPVTHSMFSVGDFVRRSLQVEGPAVVISTACSSSAKGFACASRLIDAGLCDAAVVVGVDTLCLNTLYGFSSLGLVSSTPCRPCDVHRDGLNLGEGAAFVLLEKLENDPPTGSIIFRGYGESCDGYRMAHPHPTGEGAILAMRHALHRANVRPEEIGYIKLHGTATQANDLVEDSAIHTIFDSSPPCSSIKGWIGHTLGAAGAVELVFLALCLTHRLLPGTLNTTTLDPLLKSHILLHHKRTSVKWALGNFFGFGGNNCSLLLELI